MTVLALLLAYFGVAGSSAPALGAQAPVPVVASHDTPRLSYNQALGVECSHCHTGSEWKNRTNPKLEVATKMQAMVERINTDLLRDISSVTCWTCHRGQTRPSRMPAGAWQAEQQKHFVGALASQPDTVQITMSVYNASLGVTCDFCHSAGTWTTSDRPAFAMVSRMNRMIDALPAYLPATARTQCYMCHKGQTEPARGPKS